MKGADVARAPSARQRKLVEEGAKGVAGRWIGDIGEAAKEGVRMRSAVKRFSGRPEERPAAEPAAGAGPQARARKRSTRAEQAAAGMMSPPPGTFDETAIRNWLDKMTAEDLAKLAKLAYIAKSGKEEGRGAWNKVDKGLAQRGMHVEVHGGTVTINAGQGPQGYQGSQGSYPRSQRNSENSGRYLSRLRDFING